MTRRFFYSVWEILEVVLIAAVTVFLIRAFVVQPFLVSGSSMFATFIDGDYVLVDELTYRFKEPDRGDVVVFRYPYNPKLFYIKRIIGLPGDQIVVQNGKYFVNGHEITEPYLQEGLVTSGRVDVSIGEGQMFVSGDNRPNSYDSRSFGPASLENIIGLVRVRLLPFAEAKVFEKQDYGI